MARTVVELADNLVDDFDVVGLLTTLSGCCVEVLDVSAAGIMLVAPDGRLQVMCASDSRIIIEQANGVIAERDRVDVVQAFDLLRSYARTKQPAPRRGRQRDRRGHPSALVRTLRARGR